ncbi:MAG: AraC family transcriptional regulator [Cyclobacteriaceae bacterium]
MKAVLEKIDFIEQKTIHAFVFEKERFDAPWHFHPEFELTLILESSGIRYVGNNVSDFKAGDLVLLGSNLPHCWKNESDHTDQSRSIVIQWRREVISQLPVFSQINVLLENAQRGLYIRSEKKEQIIELMHQVVAKSDLEQYLTFVELLQLIATEVRPEYVAGASYSIDLNNKTTNRLDKIQSYVHDHYKEKIKLLDVANQLHMSEQAFSRFFSKTMKKPFFEFVNEYRVNIASRVILETDRQMAEIAYQCGYESLPFFYKQFKKFKGYTPLEFRKMYRRI